MRYPVRATLLGGAAALALTGLAGVAQARSPAEHVITLALPGGGTAQVGYTGATPPHLVGFAPGMLAGDPFPAVRAAFGPSSPFAVLDAEMQQASRAMMQEAAMLAQTPMWPMPGAGLTQAAMLAGPGMCMQSVSITYSGNGAAPRVVRREAGDCGAPARAASPTAIPSYRPVPPRQPAGTILARRYLPVARPAAPRLQEAAYWEPVSPPPSR
jgi:hypothetical protein